MNIQPDFGDESTDSLSKLEILEIHEMHPTFDLLLRIRAKDLLETVARRCGKQDM